MFLSINVLAKRYSARFLLVCQALVVVRCLMNIDHIILIAYLAALFLITFFASRRINNLDDYAVAGRQYPAWVIFATMSASLIGGGYTVGNAEMIYNVGIGFMFAMWGLGLREIAVALYVAPYIHKFRQAISIGDIMGEAYGGKPMKVCAGLFAAFLSAGIVGAQVTAIGYIFSGLMGVSQLTGALIGFGIIVAYTTIGGFKAVVWTDVLQFSILMIGLPATAFYGLYAAGGLTQVLQTIPADRLDVFTQFTPIAFISLFAFYLFGETLAPPYIQRLLVGKDKKAVVRGAFWTGVVVIPLSVIVTLIALVTLAFNETLPVCSAMIAGCQILPYLIQNVLPLGVSSVVLAAMVAVIMSSADSFLNAASVTIVHDVVKPLGGNKISDKTELQLTRLFTLLTGIASIFFALSYENLVDGLLKVYGLWGPVILIPLIAAVRGYKTSVGKISIVILTGLSVSMITDYLLVDLPVSGILTGVIASSLAFALIYFKMSPSGRGAAW